MPVLIRTQLFAGIGEKEIESMLTCLQAKLGTYQKGEAVFQQGEYLNVIALLVDGLLHIQNDDYWGHRSIINAVNVGELFGEAYAAPDSGALLNDVIAAEDSTIIFFDVNKLLTVCPSACKFHTMTVKNLCFALSKKNRMLIQKIGYISSRTTREKLMAYLSEESKKHNSPSFSIPFNRQQLADFLSVDRSAMSNELCKMQKEGFLTFKKNRFTLLS